ncbi:MAG: YIP1 family protein [Candidatus Melainabacteria bacterium]|nr:YIP1 family protein [Candidatus Melainabacteria bacterium]
MQEPTPTSKVPPGVTEFATGYFSQVKSVILNPREFFDSMPTTGGLYEPLKFFAVAMSIDVVMSSITSMSLWVALTKLILLPIGLILIVLLANFLAQMMGGKGQFEATMRVYAYSSATLLVGWIPIINFLAALYGSDSASPQLTTKLCSD